MPRSLYQYQDDPFDGLLLPTNAWKALENAHIINLKQLRALAPLIETIRGIDLETAQVIKDRLARLAARRTVRVRLIFPKQRHREPDRKEIRGPQALPSIAGEDWTAGDTRT
ncbi:hypothetical protein AAII07_53780 [Microvirga sp. 0TCS3.31]|jgi:hypothetical protein